MPELPEVETIARQLDKVIVGKKIAKVEVLRNKSFVGDPHKLVGRVIKKVDRKAKMVIVELEKTDEVMLIHLKMTGQLIFRGDGKSIAGGHPTADWTRNLPSSATRVICDFSDGSKLFFNDLRVFGWMKLLSKSEIKDQLSKMPPDVTDKEFTEDYFAGLFGKSSKAVKLMLMDQARLGGVGNIYANDALYLAKIDPRRKAKELSELDIKDLRVALMEVIERGIKYGGASADKYVQTTGLGGKYQEHFLVYSQNGKRCQRDGRVIKKIFLGGRGTYFCPGCQV